MLHVYWMHLNLVTLLHIITYRLQSQVTDTVKNKKPRWHFKKNVKRKFFLEYLHGIFIYRNAVKTKRLGAIWKCRPAIFRNYKDMINVFLNCHAGMILHHPVFTSSEWQGFGDKTFKFFFLSSRFTQFSQIELVNIL